MAAFAICKVTVDGRNSSSTGNGDEVIKVSDALLVVHLVTPTKAGIAPWLPTTLERAFSYLGTGHIAILLALWRHLIGTIGLLQFPRGLSVNAGLWISFYQFQRPPLCHLLCILHRQMEKIIKVMVCGVFKLEHRATGQPKPFWKEQENSFRVEESSVVLTQTRK